MPVLWCCAVVGSLGGYWEGTSESAELRGMQEHVLSMTRPDELQKMHLSFCCYSLLLCCPRVLKLSALVQALGAIWISWACLSGSQTRSSAAGPPARPMWCPQQNQMRILVRRRLSWVSLSGQPKRSLRTERICRWLAHRRRWLPPRAQAPAMAQTALHKCRSSSSASQGTLVLLPGSLKPATASPWPRQATGMPNGVRVTRSQLRWGQGRRLALPRPACSQARRLRQQMGAQQLAVLEERQEVVHPSFQTPWKVQARVGRGAPPLPWDPWAAPERTAQERRWQQ